MPYSCLVSICGELPLISSEEISFKVMSGDTFRLCYWDAYQPGPGSMSQQRSYNYYECTLINPLLFLREECPGILANYTPFRYHSRDVIEEVIQAIQQLYYFDNQGPPSNNANARPPRMFCTTLIMLDAPYEPCMVLPNDVLSTRCLPPREDIIKYCLKKESSLSPSVLGLDCPICFEGFHSNNFSDNDNDDDWEAYVTRCDHVFHKQCVVPWFQNNHSCPVCRHPMPLLIREFLLRWC